MPGAAFAPAGAPTGTAARPGATVGARQLRTRGAAIDARAGWIAAFAPAASYGNRRACRPVWELRS